MLHRHKKKMGHGLTGGKHVSVCNKVVVVVVVVYEAFVRLRGRLRHWLIQIRVEV